MAELDITVTLADDGGLRFGLKAITGGRDDGIYDDMWITAGEWNRLVKWVEFQRADEAV